MKFYSFIFLIVCVWQVQAQTINTSFDVNKEIEETIGLVLQNDRYFILGLGRTNGGAINLGMELFITDKEGNLISQSVNKQSQYSFCVGFDHTFLINEQELIFASSAQDLSLLPIVSHSAIITSYDSLLNINWQKQYFNSFSWFRTVQLLSDGCYLALGGTDNIGNGNLDVVLMKLDSLGNEIWTKTYGGAEDDRAFSLKVLEDGNYLIGANHVYDITPNGDGWLIKTDTAGNVLWDTYIGGKGADYGIHLFGSNYFHQQKDTMHAYPWDGFSPVNYFGAYNDTGAVLWIEEIEPKEGEVIKCALELNDGGFLIVMSYIDFDYGGNVSWLIKYDENRKRVWERYYFAENSRSNGLVDVEEDADGNLVFAGTILTTDTLYNSDIWLLKLNADGCLDGGDCGEPIGILDLTIAKENFSLQVNPNPVNTTAKIWVKNSTAHFGEDLSISIYNVQGKKIYESIQTLKGQLPIVDLDCSQWQKGVYYVKASIGNKEYGQTKFLKD